MPQYYTLAKNFETERAKRYLRAASIVAFLLVFLVIPTCLLHCADLGFSPVIGNLLAARDMTIYADQVHPDWMPEGGWAVYNLVDDGYYLSFTEGAQLHSLGYAKGVVLDKEREEVLQEELEISKVFRGVAGQHDRPVRNIIWADLPEGESLTQEDILSGTLSVK